MLSVMEKEIPAEFKSIIMRELLRLKQQRRLKHVCKDQLRGLNPSRLSEIIHGSRKLTFYYLGILLNGGVVSIQELHAGKKLDELSSEERDFLIRMTLSEELIELIEKTRIKGISIEKLLKTLVE